MTGIEWNEKISVLSVCCSIQELIVFLNTANVNQHEEMMETCVDSFAN